MNNSWGCLLWTVLIVGLFTWIGWGWIINSVLILIALALITPVVAFWTFQWWVKKNLVQDTCPVCQYNFTAVQGTNFQCPNCGEPLQVQAGHFRRLAPTGTIDVEVVEVTAQEIDE